jgi:hypothetical protein
MTLQRFQGSILPIGTFHFFFPDLTWLMPDLHKTTQNADS